MTAPKARSDTDPLRTYTKKMTPKHDIRPSRDEPLYIFTRLSYFVGCYDHDFLLPLFIIHQFYPLYYSFFSYLSIFRSPCRSFLSLGHGLLNRNLHVQSLFVFFCCPLPLCNIFFCIRSVSSFVPIRFSVFVSLVRARRLFVLSSLSTRYTFHPVSIQQRLLLHVSHIPWVCWQLDPPLALVFLLLSLFSSSSSASQ